jgi:hypothetical protein
MHNMCVYTYIHIHKHTHAHRYFSLCILHHTYIFQGVQFLRSLNKEAKLLVKQA